MKRLQARVIETARPNPMIVSWVPLGNILTASRAYPIGVRRGINIDGVVIIDLSEESELVNVDVSLLPSMKMRGVNFSKEYTSCRNSVLIEGSSYYDSSSVKIGIDKSDQYIDVRFGEGGSFTSHLIGRDLSVLIAGEALEGFRFDLRSTIR